MSAISVVLVIVVAAPLALFVRHAVRYWGAGAPRHGNAAGDGGIGAYIAALQNATAGALAARFGAGPWAGLTSERSAQLAQRHARVRVGRDGKRIVTVLRLAQRKPWAIDVAHFTPVQRALYLTGMAVSVAQQGQGLGQAALEDAHRIAEAWPANAIRLDAYDAEAGAGGFYARCGYQERGRVVYRGTPLVYYEVLIP